ncbi:hypothetical protein M378DRAFT_162827, partial [Amanita muscaria Koide BX008]
WGGGVCPDLNDHVTKFHLIARNRNPHSWLSANDRDKVFSAWTESANLIFSPFFSADIFGVLLETTNGPALIAINDRIPELNYRTLRYLQARMPIKCWLP